jgi:hypothetical protein
VLASQSSLDYRWCSVVSTRSESGVALRLPPHCYRLSRYAQGEADLRVLTQGDYRPGFEFDGAAGINYRGFKVGRANIAPLAQLLVSERTADFGADANSANSGYTRLLVSPGIEVHIHPLRIYADVEVPVIQRFNGNQLAAPYLFKLNVSYMF